MSKQSMAKARQGYTPKAVPTTCATCEHFTSDKIIMTTPWSKYTKETNVRCKIGGFKVMRMGSCLEWRKSTPNQNQPTQ